MKMNVGKVLSGYLIVALLTFGYVASDENCEPSLFSTNPRSECAAVRGLVGGTLWPLYWTWEMFTVGRQLFKGDNND